MKNAYKKMAACGLVIGNALLAGCNGSSSSGYTGGPGGTGGGSPDVNRSISGPLDVIQQPLSDQLFGTVADGVAGTPLETLVTCLDQVLVNDVLDVVDGLLADISGGALENPMAGFASFSGATPDVQAAVTNLATNLMALQNSFTGEACALPGGGDGSNPLAGTPLAPLGDALSALPMPPQGGDLTALADYLGLLKTAFQDGLAALTSYDEDAINVPVLKGALMTVTTALTDLTGLLTSAASGDPSAVQAQAVGTVDRLLTNVLIYVLPIYDIEQVTGQEGVVSDRIRDGIDQLTSLLNQDIAGGFSGGLGGGFEGLGPDALFDLLDPMNLMLLPNMLQELAGAATGGGGLPTTGTPLDAILTPLASFGDVLNGGGSSDGLTGTPLDMLLDPLAGALAGGGACPIADTPLDPLCLLVDGLSGALETDPDANPLGLLTGLLDGLLGGLI